MRRGGIEELGHVERAARSEVFDLMPATGSGSDDEGVGGLSGQLIDERLGHLDREVVFFGQRAEGTGHAATTGWQQGDRMPGAALGELGHEGWIAEGFGVAMGMNRDGKVERREGNQFGSLLELLVDELFEEDGTLGDDFGVLEFQFPVIFGEHGVAGGLEEQDGKSGEAILNEFQIVGAEAGGFVEIALAESGAAAAGAVSGEQNSKAGAFEDPNGGDSDMRFVITDKGIVPEEDGCPGRWVRP